MGRRTLLLIAALVVAALGTALVFIYVNGAQQRANQDATLVKVLVASQDVAAGTTAADASAAGAFEEKEVTTSSQADGAISDITAISDEVALAPIFTGQQIQLQMFGSVANTSALSVPKGRDAISVQLGDPNRVAGFVEPGSEVVVFWTSVNGTITRVLLPKATVIGVGASTVTTQTTTTDAGATTTEQISRAILTLALTKTESQRVILGQDQHVGYLYFGLLPVNSHLTARAPTTTQNLFK